VDALKSLLGADTYVSGHNDLLATRDLQGLSASLEAKREKVRGMVAEGKSLDEVNKAYGIATTPAPPGSSGFPNLIETIYLEFTDKK
jgi:hypothetical protein